MNRIHHNLSLYLILPFLVLLLILSNVSVMAKEVIQQYDTLIIIDANGSLNITEKITVTAEGNEIKRGIYRDFPTQYKDIYGNSYKVEFELLSVMRDGQSEDYHTKSLSNGIRIYIGNKDRFLGHGTHTFTLQYYTNRQLGFYEKYDELYWNVTGNGWAFPILQASAKVQLPPGVNISQVQTDGFTGAKGDKGKNFVSSSLDDNTLFFDTTDRLPLHHGLSIVVNWPKGYVTEPSPGQKTSWFFQDNMATLVGLIGLISLWSYLYFTWLKVGKDPQRIAIYPRYYPDKQHSPASMRFVQRMGYDNKVFSSALVNMAVKGYLSITMKRKYFTLEKSGGFAKLSLGESAIARALFSHKDQIILKQAEHSIIGEAVSAHEKALSRDYEKIYFNTNKMALLPGWIGTVIILAITIFSMDSPDARATSAFFTLWLSFWSVGVIFLSIKAFKAWKNVQGFVGLIAALGNTAFAIPFWAGEIFGLSLFWQSAGTGIVLIFILIIVTNILFYEWMKAPTLKGRELLNKIEGFQYYLKVTETVPLQENASADQSPELTPELFEKYLPYAMALDVEKQWSERFNSIFSKLEAQGHHHSPAWYHGRHWDTHNISGFSSGIGDSLSSAVASSSTAPGSSSGSGGSSGGGGGGGGGGGW